MENMDSTAQNKNLNKNKGKKNGKKFNKSKKQNKQKRNFSNQNGNAEEPPSKKRMIHDILMIEFIVIPMECL